MIRGCDVVHALVLLPSLVLGAAPASSAQAPSNRQVDFDIVYVRQPRYGDDVLTIWPEVFHPAELEPGADLMLLHPDGREEVLFPGGRGSVTDPAVSLDGKSVYFVWFPDLDPSQLNSQRGNLPLKGADLWRLDLATRAKARLTHGEFTPNTGAGRWDESDPVAPPAGFNSLGYGILNMGPFARGPARRSEPAAIPRRLSREQPAARSHRRRDRLLPVPDRVHAARHDHADADDVARR